MARLAPPADGLRHCGSISPSNLALGLGVTLLSPPTPGSRLYKLEVPKCLEHKENPSMFSGPLPQPAAPPLGPIISALDLYPHFPGASKGTQPHLLRWVLGQSPVCSLAWVVLCPGPFPTLRLLGLPPYSLSSHLPLAVSLSLPCLVRLSPSLPAWRDFHTNPAWGFSQPDFVTT